MIWNFQQNEITLEPKHIGFPVDTRPFPFELPHHVQYLRIWQRVLAAMSKDTWDVLRDAIIDGEKDQAGQILASDEVMPGWRRSSVIIDQLIDWGTGGIKLEHVLAGVVWDDDLGYATTRHSSCRLQLTNPFDQPITIRPYLLCRPFSNEEVLRLSNYRGQR